MSCFLRHIQCATNQRQFSHANQWTHWWDWQLRLEQEFPDTSWRTLYQSLCIPQGSRTWTVASSSSVVASSSPLLWTYNVARQCNRSALYIRLHFASSTLQHSAVNIDKHRQLRYHNVGEKGIWRRHTRNVQTYM